jgi:hypothetical protein
VSYSAPLPAAGAAFRHSDTGNGYAAERAGNTARLITISLITSWPGQK